MSTEITFVAPVSRSSLSSLGSLPNEIWIFRLMCYLCHNTLFALALSSRRLRSLVWPRLFHSVHLLTTDTVNAVVPIWSHSKYDIFPVIKSLWFGCTAMYPVPAYPSHPRNRSQLTTKWPTMMVPRLSHLSSLHLVEVCLPPSFPADLRLLSNLRHLVVRGCCLSATTSFLQFSYPLTQLHIEGLCWHDHASHSFELIRACPELDVLKIDWFRYLYDEDAFLPVKLTSLIVQLPFLSSSESVSRFALATLGQCISTLSSILPAYRTYQKLFVHISGSHTWKLISE
ncbi:hypothetical protein F5051DRAFT_66173 [Lentinula edodes]|nr:hypothetical protein F5051DRAFT_66173 [Lentinula edodes]